MLQEAPSPYQLSSRSVTWLCWVGLTVVGGIAGDTIASLSDGLGVPLYLVFPLFFVSLGQWLLLRHVVARAERWLLTALLGILFVLPYLGLYGFSAEISAGQSLTFGTSAFWGATSMLTVLALLFGSLVGAFQGMVIIRGYGAKRGRVLCWVIANALAWAIGYPLGEQVVTSFFWKNQYWNWSPMMNVMSNWLIEGTTWLIIGMATGAVLLWLAGPQVPDRSPAETS